MSLAHAVTAFNPQETRIKAGPTEILQFWLREGGRHQYSYPAESHMEIKCVVKLGCNTHAHGAAHLGIKALTLAYTAGGVPALIHGFPTQSNQNGQEQACIQGHPDGR